MGGRTKRLVPFPWLQIVRPLRTGTVFNLRCIEVIAAARLFGRRFVCKSCLSIHLHLAGQIFISILLTHSIPASVMPAKLAHGDLVIWVQDKGNEFTVENVAGPAGAPLPVSVIVSPALLSPDSDRDDPAVTFSGLPETCHLSAGSKRTRSWHVPVDKLYGLMLLPSAGCEGDFKVLVMIYDGKEVRNDMRTILFSIHAGARMPPASLHSPPLEPITFPVSSIAPAEEEALLKKGAGLLKKGDISAARLNFETLALRGSAKGALALAQSFDPDALSSVRIAGLTPDLTKAKEWYTIAAKLGNREAAQRLSSLGPPKFSTAAGDQAP